MTDRALDTARDLIDEAVCECGHLDSEHVFPIVDGAEADECRGRPGDRECDCRDYRPVAFTVERAS